jgi:hypothetical protein
MLQSEGMDPTDVAFRPSPKEFPGAVATLSAGVATLTRCVSKHAAISASHSASLILQPQQGPQSALFQ